MHFVAPSERGSRAPAETHFHGIALQIFNGALP